MGTGTCREEPGSWRQELGARNCRQGTGGGQLGERELGTASWGQGTWDRELGTGNWGQGTGGDRELGTGNWGQGTWDRELGTGDRELRRERGQKGEVCEELQAAFPFAHSADLVWTEVAQRLAACELSALQAYPMWRRLRQEPWSLVGSTPVWGRERTAIYAGLTGQRYASSAAKGLDHLLPPGLGKEAHIAAALELPSPFAPRPWPEPDVEFVATSPSPLGRETTPYPRDGGWSGTALGGHARVLGGWRRARSQHSWPLWLHFCDGQTRCWQVLWSCMGFEIVGDVAHSGVFRPTVQEGKLSLDQWLATAAEADLARLLCSRPPEHVQDTLDLTQDEIEKEFCSPLRTAREMDDVFGVGGWRFVERFLIIQPDGKKRAIDNARKSGHNAHTTMHETISTVNVDFCASVARMLHSEMTFPLGSPPEWLDLRLGTDDLPDAHSHLPFSNVAIFLPGVGWRFTCMWGLAYGFESAVVSFNRFPQLGIAITRRCLL